MRALRLAALAVASLGFASPALADADDDWNRCNTTAIDPITTDVQIAGCTARINSGEERDANLFIGYYNRASAYYNKGDYDKALADYSQALTLAPKSWLIYYDRAQVQYVAGNFRDALADATKSAELNANWAPALSLRGLIQEKLGAKDAAIADLRRAAALDPALPQPIDALRRMGIMR